LDEKDSGSAFQEIDQLVDAMIHPLGICAWVAESMPGFAPIL
jgi:hypothetical protein